MTDAGLLQSLVEEHGTPLYVYDLDVIGERAAALHAAMPERVELAYAVKANPSLAVLARLARAGLGADVASAGELAAALAAGFAAPDIVFTGPGKRNEELAAAVAQPLRAVTVESIGELERLGAVADRTGSVVRVLLRMAGEARPDNVIGSGHGRFGMRWADLLAAARQASVDPAVDLLGAHRFDASNVLAADELLDHARRTIALASRLAADAGISVSLLDLGGGLGIPYAEDEPPLDIERVGRGLRSLIDRMDADPRLAGARLLLEPGRWLVGPAGVYLTGVVDVKESDDGPIATVDGGVHHLLRPALVGQPHRIRSLAGDGGRPRRHVLVGGPLCTSLDVLGRVVLPEPRVGDLLAVLDAGAYGFTESMPYFLSHPVPAEVAIQHGQPFVARPRLDPAELIAGQRLAPALTPSGATP